MPAPKPPKPKNPTEFCHKAVFIRVFLGMFLFCSMFCNAAAGDTMQDKIVEVTGKLVFSRDGQGVVQALVIPHTAEGHFPRSGWILCGIKDPALRDKYDRLLADKERMEGYFHVRYQIIGEGESSPILQYIGVIEGISPWEPSFLSKAL